jgi:large subunit ribosomal protein L4e
LNQRRIAVCSALAASALPSLVMARGHRVSNVQEVPLVISNESIGNVDKTKFALKVLQNIGAIDDVEHVKDSRKVRCGKGKMRNRRFVQRRGPLIIYDEKSSHLKAFRNIPGVELVNVNHLNLLQLAPGGHLGRFCIWTKAAFDKLDHLFGTFTMQSSEKKGFQLPRSKMANSDLTRIINSDEIQSHLRPRKKQAKYTPKHRNALVNRTVMLKLNPYFKVQRRNIQQKVKHLTKPKKKEMKKRRAEFYKLLQSSMVDKSQLPKKSDTPTAVEDVAGDFDE